MFRKIARQITFLIIISFCSMLSAMGGKSPGGYSTSGTFSCKRDLTPHKDAPIFSGSNTSCLNFYVDPADNDKRPKNLGHKVIGEEIDIQGNDISIADGDTSPSALDQTDFGITDPGTPIAIPFLIYSLGSLPLTLSSTVTISGANASYFTATLLPDTLAAGDVASFVITFTPDGVTGAKTATITISSNDSDEASYNFDISAQVQTPALLTSGPGGITSNLKFWLKASTNVGALNDNDAISSWTEQTTGNTKNALATFAEAPIFKNNPADNVNFNPVIYFDGSSSMSGGQGFNNQDMFVVLRPSIAVTSSDNAQYIYCGDDIDSNKNSLDFTGFGMGNTSTRHTNELASYNQGAESFYGAAEIDTVKSYSGATIFNLGKKLSGGMDISCNGDMLATSEVNEGTYKDIINSRYWLGRSESSGASFEGDILEIINYGARNTDADKDKIETYLALKYGITLGVNGTSKNYVDSAGNIIYDEAAGFNYNIAGIGRDDASGLDQKQSRTENADSDITLGLTAIEATNSGNTNTFANDREFLVWGSDNGTLEAQPTVAVNISSGIPGLDTFVAYTAIGRVWKLTQNGGDMTTAKVSIPSSLLAAVITPPGNFLMLISDSPVFNGDADYKIMTINGSDLEASYNFTGTKYITFAYAAEKTYERAVTFNGSTDYLDAGNILDFGTNFTVSAWIKNSGTDGTILSKRNSDFTIGYDLGINSAGKAEMKWINGTMQTITSSVVIPTGKWHNVGVTFDGTNALLYIDGVPDTTQVLSVVPANTQSFLMGAADADTTMSFFNGTIDEVRVWSVALNEAELRYVMNQELAAHDNAVSGNIIPPDITLNEVNDIPWSAVQAYYPMSTFIYRNIKDMSDNGYTAAIKNISTVDFQTAPLPYISAADGPWYTSATWKNGSIQDLPYSISIIDGTTRIAWNIVQTSHNIVSTGNKVMSGLDVQSNVITANNDTKIEVSRYLKLNGKIDLEGRSQLIQPSGSDLDVASSGSIERDQQGTNNIYNYNYWSSPVGGINNSANNSGFTLDSVFKDGTDPATIKDINWVQSYDGASGDPISLSDWWIYKFQNVDNDYANWTYLGANATIIPGEGFTLKGSGTANATQNYTFVGKPNNSTITLPTGAGFLNLTGNPYPSALDSQKFINDNLGSLDGTLYFWEHYPTNNTHILADYQGGYAALTITGGTPPVSPPFVSGQGSSTRIPSRYIPVGQGFLVTGSADGGTINFNNSQRRFVKEDNVLSNIMFRNANQYGTSSATDNDSTDSDDDHSAQTQFSKIRLGFNGVENFHRQLLMGFMNENASSGIDPGYDALLFDDYPSDMYFLNGDVKLVISGEGYFNSSNIYPLGVKTALDGNVQFVLDELIDFNSDQDVYVYDNVTGIYHDIKAGICAVSLSAGLYEDRFSLRFANNTLLATADVVSDNGISIKFTNSNNVLSIENKNSGTTIEKVTVVNILGQQLHTQNVNDRGQMLQITVTGISSGTYIVQLQTSGGPMSKKIIIR